MQRAPNSFIVESTDTARFRWLVAAGLAALLVWAPPPAALAEAAPEPDEQEREAVAEEEIREVITVTARKREELLIDVPFSIVAPTEEILRERGAENLEDVAANVSGFNVQNLGPGQSQVAIRGVSSGQIVRDQPGVKEQVGVYLDESVISLSLFTPDIDLFDMDRIEVLRGPQGTLFGSGSLAGTVRYITRQPEMGVSDAVVDLSLTQHDGGGTGGSVKAAVNTPLGDRAALRITAYNTWYGGFMDAVQPDLSVRSNVNSGTRGGARVAVRWEPNDQLTITPRIFYQELGMDGWNRADAYNILANPFTTTRPAVQLGERQLFNQFDEPTTDDFLLLDLTIDYNFGDVLLTSITSYTDRDILVLRDATALTGSITGGTIGLPEEAFTLDAPLFDATEVEVFTQEVRLAGATADLNWLVGGFYSKIERDYGQDLPVTGFEDLTGIPTSGLLAPRDSLFWSDLSYDFEQFALFGEATYAATDRLDLTVGLRYYDFDEEREQIFDGLFVSPDLGNEVASQPGRITASGVSPRFIASYAVTDTTRLNAQVAHGFRLGGINDPLNVPLCSPQDLITFGDRPTWDDEELWNWELGVKSSFAEGRGTLNVAGFYADISDLQVTTTAGTCSSRIIFNVPKARSAGLELELAYQPTPVFDFAVSASYNDSELRSTVASIDNGVATPIDGMEQGNRLPTVPEFQGAAAATYRWQMRGPWAGYVTGTYQHVGSRFTQISDLRPGFGTVDLHNPVVGNTIGGPLTQGFFTFNPELPSYDLVNLRVGFFTDLLEVAFFVNNLTDERALLALDQERGTLARVGFLTNPPRTFGINTRIRVR